MVFQDYALYPHMPTRQNLSLGLRLRKVPKADIEGRVADAVALLGITDLLDRKPGQLSGGQRQRVALGRAIVRQPACFLFDEPLSNLDARLRLHMRAELKSLHLRLGVTTIYVTHDQEEAMTLGSRIVVMSGGVIQQVGSPLSVYRRPVNRFVAGFLGTPPMNFVEGTVSGGLFEGGGLRVPLGTGGGSDGSRTLGIRPESITPQSADSGGVELTVEVVEPLGDRMDLYCRTSTGVRLIARVPASEDLHPGERATFALDVGAAHLFEPGELGERLEIE